MRIAPIPDLDGYFASDDGRIFSRRSGVEREIMQRESQGYMLVTVTTRVNGIKQRHRKSVHRLVLSAFAGPPDPSQNHGRHLNGDSMDNRIGNLSWGSPKENACDSIRHGTLGLGMRARRRKLTELQVLEIKSRRRNGEAKSSIAKDFGIHPEYIPHLMDGRCWPHVG